MSKKVNIICFFCPFFLFFCFCFFTIHTPRHFILFILWCKTQASSSDVRVVACCAFSVCLLWSRPPLASLLQKEKKKKRNREVKLQTEHQSEFFGISLFLSRFQERVFFGGKPDGISQKSPINILVQKNVSLLVRPSFIWKFLSAGKKKRIFGLVESGFSPAGWMWLLCLLVSQLGQSCKPSDYVHTTHG